MYHKELSMFQSIRNKVLILFFLIISINVSAQYHYASYNYYTLGVKGGYDIYNYSFDNSQHISYEMRPNFSFGVSGGLYLSYLFELHADLRYSIRNFNILWDYPHDPSGMIPALSEYQLSYIQVPIQARINALYFNWVKLNIGVGLMPEFRLRPGETITYQNGSTSESQKTWLTKNFSSVLLAVPISANLKFNLSRHVAIEISANYYYYFNKMHTEYMTKPGSAFGFYTGMYYDW